MIQKFSNLHTHTVYCDGTQTPEEMIKAAIAKGCESIGFSGHSYCEYDEGCCMSRARTTLYELDVRRLKKEYAGVIDVFLGIEQDFYSDMPTDNYDFVIGSVHYILKDGVYVCVDAGAENQKQMADTYYGGDFYAFAEAYYDIVSMVAEQTGAGIVGHFDLITKYNDDASRFNPSDERYRRASLGAMERILQTTKLFEVNTGAMYHLGRREPYPSVFLLRELQKRGGEVLLSSDSHEGASLCYAFDDMLTLLRECGFRSYKKLTKNGFTDVKI